MKRLRVGIVGAGNAAATIHLPSYAKLADTVELVGIASRDPERARALGARFGVMRAYGSAADLFAAGGLDAVSICVANSLHAPLTIAALEAGLHVYCEKPPATSPAEAAAMEAASRKAGKVLAYGFQQRFSPEAEAASAFVRSGALGRCYSGKVSALRRRGIPGWGAFGDKAAQGGGPLMDIGVHMLDLALHLMGYPAVAEVAASKYAEIGTRPGPGLMGAWDYEHYGVEDSLFGHIRFADGASLLIETAFALNMKEKGRANVELYGSEAGLSLFPLEVYGTQNGHLVDTRLPFLSERDAHAECVRDFVEAVVSSGQPRANAREGAALQAIVGMLYRSAELRRAVRADEA